MRKRVFRSVTGMRPLLLAALVLHVIPFVFLLAALVAIAADAPKEPDESDRRALSAIVISGVFLPLLVLTVVAWRFRTVGATVLLITGVLVWASASSSSGGSSAWRLILGLAVTLAPPLGALFLLISQHKPPGGAAPPPPAAVEDGRAATPGGRGSTIRRALRRTLMGILLGILVLNVLGWLFEVIAMTSNCGDLGLGTRFGLNEVLISGLRLASGALVSLVLLLLMYRVSPLGPSIRTRVILVGFQLGISALALLLDAAIPNMDCD